jgi:hypothetical protein
MSPHQRVSTSAGSRPKVRQAGVIPFFSAFAARAVGAGRRQLDFPSGVLVAEGDDVALFGVAPFVDGAPSAVGLAGGGTWVRYTDVLAYTSAL